MQPAAGPSAGTACAVLAVPPLVHVTSSPGSDHTGTAHRSFHAPSMPRGCLYRDMPEARPSRPAALKGARLSRAALPPHVRRQRGHQPHAAVLDADAHVQLLRVAALLWHGRCRRGRAHAGDRLQQLGPCTDPRAMSHRRRTDELLESEVECPWSTQPSVASKHRCWGVPKAGAPVQRCSQRCYCVRVARQQADAACLISGGGRRPNGSLKCARRAGRGAGAGRRRRARGRRGGRPRRAPGPR